MVAVTYIFCKSQVNEPVYQFLFLSHLSCQSLFDVYNICYVLS